MRHFPTCIDPRGARGVVVACDCDWRSQLHPTWGAAMAEFEDHERWPAPPRAQPQGEMQ